MDAVDCFFSWEAYAALPRHHIPSVIPAPTVVQLESEQPEKEDPWRSPSSPSLSPLLSASMPPPILLQREITFLSLQEGWCDEDDDADNDIGAEEEKETETGSTEQQQQQHVEIQTQQASTLSSSASPPPRRRALGSLHRFLHRPTVKVVKAVRFAPNATVAVAAACNWENKLRKRKRKHRDNQFEYEDEKEGVSVRQQKAPRLQKDCEAVVSDSVYLNKQLPVCSVSEHSTPEVKGCVVCPALKLCPSDVRDNLSIENHELHFVSATSGDVHRMRLVGITDHLLKKSMMLIHASDLGSLVERKSKYLSSLCSL